MPDLNTEEYGQDLLAEFGQAYGNITDANAKTRYTNAVGTIGQLGLWRKMEQTSGAVQIGRRSLIGVLLGARFTIEGHPDINEKVLEHARVSFLERMQTGINTVAANIFEAVFNGFGPQEITLFHEGGKTFIKDLSPRPAQTIQLHTIKRGDDGWYRCEQKFYKADGTMGRAYYGGPGEGGKGWLLWPIHGNNNIPTGEGFYRPIWAIYNDRATGAKYRTIAIQKCALGTPVVRQRVDLGSRTGPSAEEVQDTCKQIAQIIVHEKGVISLPWWAEEIEYVWGDPKSIEALTQLLQACDVDILMQFSAQYAARGTLTNYGTNAASESDQVEQGGHRGAMLQWLCEQMQPLIRWHAIENYGEQKYYPFLCANFDREISPSDLVSSMSTAVRDKLLIIDSGVRGIVRSKFDLEPEGKDIINAEEAKAKKPLALPPAIPPSFITPAKPDLGDETDVDDEGEGDELCSHHGHVHSMAARQKPRPGGQDRRTGPNGRPLAAIERLVDWDRIELGHDQAESSLKLALMDARRDVVRYLADQAKVSDIEDPLELARFIQGLEVPGPMKAAIERRIKIEIDRIINLADETVDIEREQQGGARPDTAFASAPINGYGDLSASAETDEALQDGRGQLLEIVKATLTQGTTSRADILQLLDTAANELNAAEATANATTISGETFAKAREAHVKELVDETGTQPKAVYYSAILDANTCDPCAFADASFGSDTEGIKWGSPEMAEYMPPYQRCLGGARCRCVYIYEWE